MKSLGLFLIASAIAAWLAFIGILLRLYSPTWLPREFTRLQFPNTAADLGQSLAVVDGLMSSIALVLGLLAMLTQMRQQADANTIGALNSRHQYLLAEAARLEEDIQRYKESGAADQALLQNMANKKSRYLKIAASLDERLERLLLKG